MAHSALRSPTISCQFSLHKYDKLYNRPTLSHWSSIQKCKRQLESRCRALKWEIESSYTHENQPKGSDGDFESPVNMSQAVLEGEDTSIDEMERNSKENEIETLMLSVAPLPYLVLAALLVADTIRSVFGPFAELVKTWNLPDWLVHWGHPGNMAVVLFAMGGYGSYLGWQIRLSDDVAKDLHPKLLAGMFFFFALGATGGITSLLTSDKPILESPHAVTGLIGLSLLTIQTLVPTLFEGNPNLRSVHGLLGSGITTLFLIHSVLGLQLGISF